jgi:hypothetical protein
MHKLSRFMPNLTKVAKIATAGLPSAPAAAAAIGPAASTLPTAPMRRDYGTRFSFDKFQLFNKEEKKKTSFINRDYAQAILEKADPSALAPRDPAVPPTREGLLALVSYTSNGMLAAQMNDALAGKKIPTMSAQENGDLKELADLVMETVSRLKPVAVDTVRRNTAIAAEGLQQYTVGNTITTSRLTSVTFNDSQVYTGGNVDFVYHPKEENGVVSLAALSDSNRENEGLLIPDKDRQWLVENVEHAQEGERLALDPDNYPPRTIHLREV